MSYLITNDVISPDKNATGSQWQAHEAITDILNKKHKSVNVIVTNDFPRLRNHAGGVVLGSFSWYDMPARTKYIRPAHAVYLDGVDFALTPSQVARAYLQHKFGGKRHRMRTSQYRYMVHWRKSHPLYSDPQMITDAVYLDIKSAYWAILSVVGLNPEYYPFEFLGRGVLPEDFPYPHVKMIRNILVSAGLPSRGTRWTGEKLEPFSAQNPHINLMLWSVAQDVLNTFARDMVIGGAVYVHTDGFIFPRAKRDIALTIAKSWGFQLGTKYQGECVVIGPSMYRFANRDTVKEWDVKPLPHCNIQPVPGDWLRQKFKSWADKSTLYNPSSTFENVG